MGNECCKDYLHIQLVVHLKTFTHNFFFPLISADKNISCSVVKKCPFEGGKSLLKANTFIVIMKL